MDFLKFKSSGGPSLCKASSNFGNVMLERGHLEQPGGISCHAVETDVDVDIREVYFLILHFLSSGPCQRTFGQLCDELLEHRLLPRRYHACYSNNSVGNENDVGDEISLPLSYSELVERYSHIEKDHLVKLLKQLIMVTASPGYNKVGVNAPNAADVPTLLGPDSFSLLNCDRRVENKLVKPVPAYMRWPHMQADQVRGLTLREIGGGFTKHHRAPSIRSACYAIAKPSTMFQRMQNTTKLRGHRDAVYCAIFDRTGRYVITGSDDRLVKIWSMETAYCLTSCRGHEGDITDLAVSSNNHLVASASNDFVIRVWRIPDGAQISVLRGHTGAVTAIAFSPKPTSVYQLLSSSDDGTCRIWDVRSSQCSTLIYVPNPSAAIGKSNGLSINGPLSSNGLQSHQILCCAYNANGNYFVTGSSDTFARVWNACKHNAEDSEQPIHELDLLSGHENDVNYVQFSGCAVPTRSSISDIVMENIPKFKNSWFCHDNIVTCSRDGSAIIWIPRSRRSHGKSGRWVRAYHLRVPPPPPPLPPQPLRGGPRQRLLPTPRGVNMIIWSLDNHFVLAAIMDCRICVWNAVDGSLVHSLTGHTQSSYVLDVHPFNPRIAMSAGYDGKTIVWDIWEGSPIKIYEVGPYKLVDGKFSPDGTSIVLSDEVGQIYLLNTGQGESQKDAKYDQFFLGDYRPLIRDSSGNVLDQETQLPPHRRNIQDPLCDSSLIPYPEPYQTMYQNRRLGALGLEWRPSSINLVVGRDISLGQDYLMPPLEDLDRIFEPLPQFIEPIYWEPENEAVSDDPDSDYNAAEECFSEGERDSLGSHYSSEPECSADDSDPVSGNKDGLRKSRRRNHATEMEMTSGGCVRKRNSDEYVGTLSGSNRVKKSKSGRKASKRKSSTKTLRPQRVAARSALSMFSKMNGSSTDGDDEDDSGDDSADSDLVLLDSGSWKSDRNFQHPKGTHKDQPLLVDSKDIARTSELQSNSRSRKRLILKLSCRPKMPVASEESRPISNKEADSMYPSFQEHTGERMIGISPKYEELSSSNAMDVDPCQNHNSVDTADGRHPDRADECAVECASNKGRKIGWAEVGIRTSKSSPLEGDILSDASTEHFNIQEENSRDLNRDDKQFGSDALHEATFVEIGKPAPDTELSPLIDRKQKADTSTASPLIDQKLKLKADASTASGTGNLKESATPKLKFIIKTKRTSQDSISHSNVITAVDQADSKLKIGDDVQNKEKAHVARTDPLGCDGIMGEETSSAVDYHHSRTDLSEAATDTLRRPRSMPMKATSWGPNANCNFKVREMHGLVGTSRNEGCSSTKAFDQQWISGSKGAVRLRSSRNRQDDPGILTGKKSESNHPIRKLSWLMLSKQEEGYSYIPQLGDEVAYLRQGHEDCIREIGLPDVGPWNKGNVRAVEICKVKKLSYATLPGSGDCCCKITLKFVDPSSNVFGQKFELTLPELISSPDFVVEKTWFDDSLSRNWTNGDKCRVWWRSSENGEGGRWWEGQILFSLAKSDQFPDSPWERYAVQYDGIIDDEINLHCPWELHDPVIPSEHAHIDFGIRDTLLDLFAKLEQSTTRHQDCYGFQKLNDAAQKLDFLNRFDVPLYPEIIELRLKNDYYRRFEAVKQDIDVMLSNAEFYFAKNAQLSAKVKRLKDWFTKKLSRF